MSAYDSGEVSVEAQAKAWVDAVNSATGPSGGWRLQLVRMRTRRKFGKPPCGDDASTLPAPGGITDANGEPVASAEHGPDAGECPEAPVRIRRFVSGCPWALVDQAIRYLHRIAPYRGIVYNGARLEGVYRPTVTQWVRDEQSQSPGERGSLGTYTLVQDLVEVTCCGDEETLGTGDSCQSAEKTTYVWDADSVEPLPTDCAQGVTYALRAVSRGEDGSFSYQLVKSVAKTVAWGPVTISCGPLEAVEEWGWRNLYGCPGSFRADECYAACPSSRGLDTIPADGRCDEAAGVRTEAQWQLNQDCTWDVRVRRRTAKPKDGGWADGTSCREVSHVVYRSSPGVPDVEPPAPGERVSASFRLNDDMTWDGEVSRAAAPEPLEYGWTEGSACRSRAVEVYEDQVVRPKPPELSSLAPGETLEASVSRTEDCLWNARFVRTAAPEADHMQWTEGSSCQQVDSHRYVNQTSYAGLVPEPRAGQRVSADVSRNADCTYDVSYKVQKPYEGADVEWDDGAGCQVRHHTLWIDKAEKPVVGAAGPGETVSASLRFDPSSCTWSGERVVTEAASAEHMQWTEGTACRPTRSHRLVNQTSYAGLVPAPSAGQRVSADVSRNADCTYDVRYSVTDPADAGAGAWADGSCSQQTFHTLYSDVAGIVSPGPGGTGVTTSASWARNEDCTYTGRVSRTVSVGDQTQWTEGTGCRPVNAYVFWNSPGVSIPGPGRGERVSASVSRNPDCTYDYQYRVASAPEPSQDQWHDGSCSQHATHTLYTDADRVVDGEGPSQGRTVSASWTRNEDCTYTGHVSVVEAQADTVSWTEGVSCRPTHVNAYWNQSTFSVDAPGRGERVSVSVSRNPDCTYDYVERRTPPAEPFDDQWHDGGCKTPATHTLYTDVDAIRDDEQPGTGKSVSASWTRNEDCTYTGRVTVTKPQAWEHREEWDDGPNHVVYTRYGNQESPMIQSDSDSSARVSNSYEMSDATCLYDGASTLSYPRESEGGGEDDYLWGPLFDGPSVSLLGIIGDPDPLTKVLVGKFRVTYQMTGSRHYHDFSEDLRTLARRGWTVAHVNHYGSYNKESSTVFSGTVFKDIEGTEDGMLIDRTKEGSSLQKAIADAIAAVRASPEAMISGF